MENNITNLFVYGSLRSGFCHPAYEYISKYFSLISAGRVKGLLYDLGDYPAAIVTSEEAFVTGELYKVKDDNEFQHAIELLDIYEETGKEEGDGELYKRKITEVIYNNTTASAWIYWYNKSIVGQPLIPSGDVMDAIEVKSKSSYNAGISR